jgi:hypothetical protein
MPRCELAARDASTVWSCAVRRASQCLLARRFVPASQQESLAAGSDRLLRFSSMGTFGGAHNCLDRKTRYFTACK